MADTKISNLTALTLPVAAADETVITRSGTTRKVSASNLALGLLGGMWTTITKTGDESVTNNTIQNDDELFFTTTSGKVYEIELAIVYGSPVGAGTPDIKIDLGEDGTTRGAFTSIGLSTADAAQVTNIVANQTATITAGTAAADRILKCMGVFTGNGGTFRLRWAQNTTNANATIVRAGSALRYRQLT